MSRQDGSSGWGSDESQRKLESSSRSVRLGVRGVLPAEVLPEATNVFLAKKYGREARTPKLMPIPEPGKRLPLLLDGRCFGVQRIHGSFQRK